MTTIPNLQIQPLHPSFIAPKVATEGAAGFDIYMPEAGHIPAGASVKVNLGFSTAIPVGHVGLMLPRSGVGSRDTLELANTAGAMDSDFRGEWVATLRTKHGEPFSWEAGERLIQVLIIERPEMTLSVVDHLDDTARGQGGLGSTGA